MLQPKGQAHAAVAEPRDRVVDLAGGIGGVVSAFTVRALNIV